MLGAQCTSHRRHKPFKMKNKIYDFGSFAQNFYLSVAKVKVRSWESNSKSPADMVAYSNDCAVLFP